MTRFKSRVLSRDVWLGLMRAYWNLLKARHRSRVMQEALGSTTRLEFQSDDVVALTMQQKRAIRREVRLIDFAARHPFQWAFCLQRSQALLWRLRDLGIDAELRVGVRKDGSQFSAHAWVQYGRLVLNDHQDIAERYAPLVWAGDERFDVNLCRGVGT